MKTLVSFAVLILLFATVAVGQTNSRSSYSGSNTSNSTMSRTQITNGPVAETIADSSALIGWSSSEAAKGCSLRYGSDREHMSETAEVTDNTDGKNHHAKLEGLAPDTTYYFQVMQGGSAVGGIGTFHTVAAGEKPIKSKAVISQ